MSKLENLLQVKCAVIGMIHLQALPGTPTHKYNPQQIIDLALTEARTLYESGVDGIMIENMHDIPYLKINVGPEVNAMMSIIGYAIKRQFDLPCGIQVLSSANFEAIAAACAGNLDFIRAEGFAYGHLADEGYIDACAGKLLRYRKKINADQVAILTDIKKKHSSHTITSDISLAEMAKTCEFFMSDGIIITGTRTAQPVNVEEIASVREATKLPVLAGSGVSIDNVHNYVSLCDALIVGSHFKKEGYWANELDEDRVRRFMEKVNKIR